MKLFTSAGDDLTVQWYKANGFQPVPLSSADMLSSLTTGMIEAVPVTPLSALSFQWYRYTPYMLDVGISPLVGATIVTRKAWDAISEADRTQLMAAAQKTEDALPNGSAAHRRRVDRRDAEERLDGRQGRPGRPGRVPHRRRWLRQDDARRLGAAPMSSSLPCASATPIASSGRPPSERHDPCRNRAPSRPPGPRPLSARGRNGGHRARRDGGHAALRDRPSAGVSASAFPDPFRLSSIWCCGSAFSARRWPRAKARCWRWRPARSCQRVESVT